MKPGYQATQKKKQKGTAITVRIPNVHKNVMFETSDISDDQADTITVQNDVEDCIRNNVADPVTDNQKAAKIIRSQSLKLHQDTDELR